jgi:hypothetical protein
MLFELRNEATGDTLRLEVPVGKFRVAHDIELEGIPAPVPVPTREQLRAQQFAECDEEELRERKRRWSKTPKRSLPGAGGAMLSYWNAGRWEPFTGGEMPWKLPDPDASGYPMPDPNEPGLFY